MAASWIASSLCLFCDRPEVVLGFQYQGDAERFLQNWRDHLQKFGLELHPDKTRLLEFGRFAAASRQ
jgi:RNA-directed DNA polymerase